MNISRKEALDLLNNCKSVETLFVTARFNNLTKQEVASASLRLGFAKNLTEAVEIAENYENSK